MKNRSVEAATLLFILFGASACASVAPPVAAPSVAQVKAPAVQASGRHGEGGSPTEVVAGLREEFSSCYQGGLWTNPAQRGSVRLELDIDAVGHPKAVNTKGGRGLDRKVLDCLDKVAASATFAPPRGGSAMVIIPLTFASAR